MSYAQQSDNSRKRVAGFMIVVLLHAGAVYALVNGLARKIVEVVRAPLQTKVIEEVKPPAPPDKLPPPPPPRLVAPPPPYIPPPEVQVQPPPQIQQTAITVVTTEKPTEPPRPIGPAPTTPVRTAAVVDARGCEKPAYPPASLRANETGTVRLSFLIEADGSIVQSRIEVSSGSRRLDDAARKGLGLCKFKPATVDGRPERAWARIDYVWKVE